eukprot:CAMPEP_0182417464 /NCGR_PEP_ID=MMETSP1167-20130531/1957_1 /TAXON_ID=2988 /ORGANISM="Mallomonas Sp, Strain CCMP3275" /LENGTH=334 /DNA_ID=CAMNT_0024591071 /DNA_START=113 /DNA_END=1117 /DNA_ORIENTATION=+
MSVDTNSGNDISKNDYQASLPQPTSGLATAAHALHNAWTRIRHPKKMAPRLSSTSREEWILFYPQFKRYVEHYGPLKLQSQMDSIVITVYAFQFHLTIDAFKKLPEIELVMLIDYHHQIVKNFEDILKSFHMNPTDNYDKDNCEEYIERFMSHALKFPGLINHAKHGGKQQDLVKIFIHGLYPLVLRELVEERHPETLKEVVKTLRRQCEVMDIHTVISERMSRLSTQTDPSQSSTLGKPSDHSRSLSQPLIRTVYTSREAFMNRSVDKTAYLKNKVNKEIFDDNWHINQSVLLSENDMRSNEERIVDKKDNKHIHFHRDSMPSSPKKSSTRKY